MSKVTRAPASSRSANLVDGIINMFGVIAQPLLFMVR